MAKKNEHQAKNNGTKMRNVDLLTDEIFPWWRKTFVYVKKKEVATWKGALVLMFVTGVAVAMIWSVRVDSLHMESKAAAINDGSISLSASSTTVSTGAVFNVTAKLNTGSNKAAGADVHITFNASLLTLNSITCPATNFTNPMVAASINNNSGTGTGTGSIMCTQDINTPASSKGVTSASADVATFNFTPKAVGSAQISFDSSTTVSYDITDPTVNIIATWSPITMTINLADITGPSFNITDGASPTSVKTDTINITLSDATGVASSSYGFSTASTCNASNTTINQVITLSGSSGATSRTGTVTVTGNHTDYLCVKAIDTVTPTANVSYQTIGPLHIDNTVPIVTQTTAVPSPTNDTTPSYTFSSSEAGTIQYAGDCSSSNAIATAGSNIITFNTLSAGTHSNCTIRVTDTAGNQSSVLSVNSFVIDNTVPIVTQTTAVPSPTNDTTPSYTFSSSEAGTIQYAGDCSSSNAIATAGSNIITFNTLSAGTHSNCTIRVTDTAGNQSTALAVNNFTIDTTAPNGSISYMNGFGKTTVSIAVSATDASAGPNTAAAIIQRTSVTPSSGICTFSANPTWTTISTGTSGTYNDATIVPGTCYKYRYSISDYAGNQANITSASVLKVTWKSDISPVTTFNGIVDYSDYTAFLAGWGTTTCGNIADIVTVGNSNCKVDLADYSQIFGDYGNDMTK